jgi:hypothetical protein
MPGADRHWSDLVLRLSIFMETCMVLTHTPTHLFSFNFSIRIYKPRRVFRSVAKALAPAFCGATDAQICKITATGWQPL